jgi:signal transduction histidine kinase
LITEKIIKEIGGDLGVESELSKGTTFTIFVPYQEAAIARDRKL